MSDQKRINVGACAICPLVDDSSDPWRCRVGLRVSIPRARYFDDPPDWCPLRQADHVVMLRVK